jgi:hypothetical protein
MTAQMTLPIAAHRIQLSRRRGWRLPTGAVSVARPTRWGNPFVVCETQTREQAVDNYRRALLDGRLQNSVERVRRELAGKHLACWCPLAEPCHADVLLAIAAGTDP